MADVGDTVAEAREALSAREWQRAYDLLQAAEAERALPAEELELLVQAAVWAGAQERSLPFRELAYARRLEAGDVAAAARHAVELAHEYGTVRLQQSVGNGWLARAVRLLATEPEGPAHGYLALEQSLGALRRGNLDDALERGRYAATLGREHHDRALEVRGLQREGMALIARGDVAEGKLLLDEATAAAVAGEIDPFSTVVVYCNTIGACRDVGAFDQAGEWTERASAYCDDLSVAAFPGMCRVNRAEVLRFEGKLVEAEETARQAFDELQSWAPRIAAAALNELGEIRLRLGDLAKAEEAFDRADELGREPEPGRSLLLLARGRTSTALASVRRALADGGVSVPARAVRLPAYVEIAVAAGEPEEAERAAAELREIADRFDTPALYAAAGHADGAVLLARGDGAGAAARLRPALRLWQGANAGYEAARTRELLGRAYRLDGDEEAALHELETAAAAFDRLGARLDSERVASLLGRDAGARVVKTFVFTDIVDSTRTVEAVGDVKWARALRWHDETVRAIVDANGGETVDHTGDGFFLAFDETRQAVDVAVAIQRALAAQPLAPDVRIGIHATEATSLGASYRGLGVHEAARIGALAGAGEILASARSVDRLRDLRIGGRRTETLKGVRKPIDLVEIDWR